MRRFTLLSAFVLTTLCAENACAQNDGPQPPAVRIAAGKAPSDAVVLFDGTSLSKWKSRKGPQHKCDIAKGEMVCKTGVGDMISTETFRDAQIHLEFALPAMPNQRSQLRANSGLYIQGRYEVQILDNFNNPTYANGHSAAVYGQHIPLANPSLGPDQWQSYDLIFRAPQCDAAGKVTKPGSLTLLFNGVLVQDHVPMQKATPGGLDENVCQPGPILLQDHSGFPGAPMTALRFRNIWFRRLDQ